MKPEPRIVKKRSTQFEPHADPSKHVMMSQRKAKSDLKLGKAQSRLAKRKKVLRTEKAKQESSIEKEERKKKETERKRIWRLKQKEKQNVGKPEVSSSNKAAGGKK
jgi:hypothetical protein